MKIKAINPLSKRVAILDLNVSQEQLQLFNGPRNKRPNIQNIFTELNSDEREFIQSGTLPGLYEIQFEKHFVFVVEKFLVDVRYEMYFSKSLGKFKIFKFMDDVLLSTTDSAIIIDNNVLYLGTDLKKDFNCDTPTYTKLIKKINSDAVFVKYYLNLVEYNEKQFDKNDLIFHLQDYLRKSNEMNKVKYNEDDELSIRLYVGNLKK